MQVVIVESPAKAKTINKYLGDGYKVLASYGHIRDLPPKDGSVRPDEDFAMIWELEDRGSKRVSEIARAVKGAEKLILCTSVAGLLEDVKDPRRLVSYGDLGTVEDLTRQGAVSGGMLPKLSACTEALKGGVSRVHLIDGTRAHSLLLELFTNEGCGTMLVARREG